MEDSRFVLSGNKHNATYKLEQLPSGDVMVDVSYKNLVPNDMAEFCERNDYYKYTKFSTKFIVGSDSMHFVYIDSHGH